MIYLTGTGAVPCYSVYMQIRITHADSTKSLFNAPEDRALAFFRAFWDLSYAVDPKNSPDAPVTVSLENGDFIARVIVDDWNRDEYGEQAHNFFHKGEK